MAMNAAALKTEMKAAVRAAMFNIGFDPDHPDTNGEADNYIDALSEGIANAVVAHLQANAQTVDTGTPTVPAGLWPLT